MTDQRQWLGVVNDDQVVVEMHSHRIFEHDLLVGRGLKLLEIDLLAMKRIVHLLGNVEKSGRPWITRQPVLIPNALVSKVNDDRSSATPPP
jgi:hypothetical protein